jgi:hypothetical protein
MSTLQTSGSIAFSEIQTQFGGSNPIALSEYYKGGSYVSAPENIPTYSSDYRVVRNGSWGSNGNVYFYWAGTLKSSINGYTTFAGAYSLDLQDAGDGYLYNVVGNYSASTWVQYFTISRYNKANYNLPTSGQISMNQFYGAGSN